MIISQHNATITGFVAREEQTCPYAPQKASVTLLPSYNVTRLWVINHSGYVNFVRVLKPKTIQVQWPLLLIPVLSRQRRADL